jgi:excisionase family DNA binding protein
VAKPTDKPKDSSGFITPEEVAQDLRVNILTVYKYIRQGSLGAIRIGRNYRISQKDLTVFIKSKRVRKLVSGR